MLRLFRKKRPFLYRYYQTPSFALKSFSVMARDQDQADRLARKRFDQLWENGEAANAIYFRDSDAWRHQLLTPTRKAA